MNASKLKKAFGPFIRESLKEPSKEEISRHVDEVVKREAEIIKSMLLKH